MKLYSGPLSLFTAKVRIALAEKELDYERIEVGWSLEQRYLPHHPEVVALNPKAEVPVLVDDHVTVADSTQILKYLEERDPRPPLYPEGLGARARCRRLEAAADELFFPLVWELIDGSFYPGESGGAAPEAVPAAHAAITAHLTGLEAELGDRPYLCGEYSVADIAYGVFFFTTLSLGYAPPATLPNLMGWAGRLGGRPAVKRELDEMRAFQASL